MLRELKEDFGPDKEFEIESLKEEVFMDFDDDCINKLLSCFLFMKVNIEEQPMR